MSASIRVLIVDDSAFMRFTIAKRLDDTPGVEVAGTARDGRHALELITQLNPDVVTMDVEMPHLNGLATLREIMANHPRPVIMLSSLTTDGARETIQALTLGAVDFIAKPSSKANIDSIMDELVAKIRRASNARVRNTVTTTIAFKQKNSLVEQHKFRPLRSTDKILVIGSSTGGPRALNSLVPELPLDLDAALLIVQHMPPGFTRSLAERLDSLSPMAIKEAEPGDRLAPGLGLLAPGGNHMVVDQSGAIALNQNPPVHGVRPAIDVTLSSVVQQFGAATVGVILTGMGSDGTNGAALIKSAGGTVLVEDESTCVVWGMPRSVFEAGLADEVYPLHHMAEGIVKTINKQARPV